MQEIIERVAEITMDEVIEIITKRVGYGGDKCVISVQPRDYCVRILIGLSGGRWAWIDQRNPVASIREFSSIKEALCHAKNNNCKLFFDRCDIKTMLNQVCVEK